MPDLRRTLAKHDGTSDSTRQADRSGDLGGQAQAVSRKIHVPGCDFNTIFVLILRLEIWDWTGLF